MVQNSNGFAPIAFFVYKRLDHTKQTLEALAANTLAQSSDLFIFSDGPRGERDEEGVLAVRDYIRSIKGFRSVAIKEHEHNQGLAKSLISGITDLCDKYGRVIVVEDDVLTSKYFLQFMNDSLEKYECSEDVFSICGFWPLTPDVGDDKTLFLNYFAVWGWATWKRAWDFYDYNAAGWEALLKNKRMAWDFDLDGRSDCTAILLSQVKDNINTWDVQWGWVIYRDKRLCAFPPYSFTTNIGFDDTGEHTSLRDRWVVQNINLSINGKIKFETNIEMRHDKRSALGKFYYYSITSRRGFSLKGIFWTFYRSLRYVLMYVPYVFKIKNYIRL
jgi:hypothetical protein